jgi:hypothetical protein
MGGFSERQQAMQSKARPPSASVTSVRVEDGGIDIECEVEPPESPHSLGALATTGARGIAVEFEVAPSAQSSQIFSGDLLPAASGPFQTLLPAKGCRQLWPEYGSSSSSS